MEQKKVLCHMFFERLTQPSYVHSCSLKGKFTLLPVVIFMNLDSFGVSGLVLESTILSYCVREKAEISKTRQLAPKLFRLINSSTGKREMCSFDFGVNCPFKYFIA